MASAKASPEQSTCFVASTWAGGQQLEAHHPRLALSQALLASIVQADDSLRNFSLGHGETVLVVEAAGERLLADEEMLAALGYEPVGFTCAGDALAACRATPRRFDALLVGHLTPANSALGLAAALHQSVPDVPILLATASADEVGADALAAAGISEVVRRPLVSAEIASVLARWLHFRKLRSPSYDRNAFAQY